MSLELDSPGKRLRKCVTSTTSNQKSLIIEFARAQAGAGNVLSIDKISLGEGGFIDIGEPIMGDPVYPVVVKSLVFEF